MSRGGHEAARAVDAGFLQFAFVRGVAVDGKVTGFLDARGLVRAQVEHDEGQSLGLEFLDDVAAHAAVAADDNVIGKLVEQVQVVSSSPLAGQTLADVQSRHQPDLTLLACKHATVIGTPGRAAAPWWKPAASSSPSVPSSNFKS